MFVSGAGDLTEVEPKRVRGICFAGASAGIFVASFDFDFSPGEDLVEMK